MSDPRKRMGLVLTGGGVTGAMYDVGAVAALEDAVEDFRAADFDVFVGVSTGATVAAALAGGIAAQRLYRALLDPSDVLFPLERRHVLKLAAGEWRRVLGTVFGAARRAATSVSSRPLEADLWNELDRFWDSIPAGVFTLSAYEKFFGEFLDRRGIPHRFEDLPRRLAVVATDLDGGDRAVFGRGALAGVPLEKAVAAACAVPILFEPVRIDGRDYVEPGLGDTAHADVAVDMGCDLVVVVHADVAVQADLAERDVPTGHGPGRHVRDKGMLWVYDQAMRVRNGHRLREGLGRYRAAHPGVHLAVVEPDPADAVMFMHSPMNFAARRTILEAAYRRTRKRLENPASSLRRSLEAHGLTVKARAD